MDVLFSTSNSAHHPFPGRVEPEYVDERDGLGNFGGEAQFWEGVDAE